jgi:hypothetical protein
MTQKLVSFLPAILAGAGAWAVLNGLLHDIFVLMSEHGKQYNRDLLRLLMDGHILITCGIVQCCCYKGLQSDSPFALYIALTVTLSLLLYCGMIFPFLRSLGTITINTFVLLVIMTKLFSTN